MRESKVENEYKNGTDELLCEVYRNVTMAKESLCDVTGKIDNKFMMKNVTGQLGGYAELEEKCERMMKENGVTPKKESAMKRLMAKGGIMLNTAVDSSDSHVAEMIIKGTDMGADTLEKAMHECKAKGCSSEASELCERVLKFERGASDAMREFT